MKKDPTEFRQRFAAWKNGEKPYENGLPSYSGGKEPDYEFDGYNYTYQNKTKNGMTLSIRNGRLYSGNKIVGAGYTWYDKNNGNTYRTIGKGKFKIVSTEEGPVKNRQLQRHDDAHYIYKADDKDVTYLKNEVDPDDLTGSDKLFLYRSDFVNNRLNTEELYAIPQHLPGVKRRTLSTGPYKGVRIYDNTLDTIRVNSARNNIPFIEGLGLAAETSLGKDSHMSMNSSKLDYNLAMKYPYYNSTQNGRHVLFPTDMINNHNYYVGNNATGAVNTLIRNGTIPGILSWGGGQKRPFPIIGGAESADGSIRFTDLTDKLRQILDEEAEKVLKRKETSSDNPWENAFEFYKHYNYGMGTSYPNTVKQRGASILNTPELLQYLKYAE